MKARFLVMTVLVAGLIVGAPSSAGAYFPAFVLDILGAANDDEAVAILFGSYSTTPPQRSAQDPTEEATKDCKTGAPFALQRKVDGEWTTIKSGRTNDKGKGRVKFPNKSGTYRGKMKEYTTPDGNMCFEGFTNVVRHKK